MPEWNDISLSLYKRFSEECLFPKTFRYYLENDTTIDVEFERIDQGLDIDDFRTTPAMRKRLNDNKDRVRMFACVYHILKTGTVFYVEEGNLKNSEVKVDYIKSKIINGKGVHLGMRYEEEVYVPLTMLVDRAVNPNKSLEGLDKIEVRKLEIIESGKIIETIEFK